MLGTHGVLFETLADVSMTTSRSVSYASGFTCAFLLLLGLSFSVLEDGEQERKTGMDTPST